MPNSISFPPSNSTLQATFSAFGTYEESRREANTVRCELNQSGTTIPPVSVTLRGGRWQANFVGVTPLGDYEFTVKFGFGRPVTASSNPVTFGTPDDKLKIISKVPQTGVYSPTGTTTFKLDDLEAFESAIYLAGEKLGDTIDLQGLVINGNQWSLKTPHKYTNEIELFKKKEVQHVVTFKVKGGKKTLSVSAGAKLE